MKKLITLSFLLFVLLGALSATIIRVNNNPNLDADYTDLQAAIDAAVAGDTIYLEQSAISYGDAVINKRLIVIGGGYLLDENTQIKPDARSTSIGDLDIGSSSSPDDNLANGTVLIGISFAGSTVKVFDQSSIIRCLFSGTNGDDLDFESLSSSGSLVSQCIFSGIFGGGPKITFSNAFGGEDPTNNTISNCIFYGSGFSASNGNVIENNTFIYISGGGSNSSVFATSNSTVKNNLIIQGNADLVLSTNSTGNSMINNVIVTTDDTETDYVLGEGSTDGQWQLSEGSLAAGAGENGVDVGAYGGLSPYVLSGVPPIPRISSISIPTTGSSSTGLQVQVTIKSQN
jgi:hypothetical protein